MSDSENSVDIGNVWCEGVKNDFEKMENEFNEMIGNFNKYIDNYSISTERSILNKVNQTFGEISQLIYIGRQIFYFADIGFVEYRKKFAERVFKIINVSAYIIKSILNREDIKFLTYFYNEYENLKILVYEMVNKRLAH
jgi:hypothetical protein